MMNTRLMIASFFLCQIASAAPAQDVCRSGFVWREAYPGDHACVAPERREQARLDNRLAARRVQPGGGAYGPATCRQGYVWREARPGDVVCVTPEARSTTAEENRLSAQRKVTAGPVANAGPGAGCDAACQRDAERLRTQLRDMARRKALKQQQLARAEAQRREEAERRRREDAEWARRNPGLGRSSQPMIVDSVTPLRNDIRDIDKAMAEAERKLRTIATQPPAPAASAG